MLKMEPPKVPLLTRPLGIFGSLSAARRNILEIIPQTAVEQPMITGKTATVRWHMVMDPQANRRILLENLDNYPKSDVTKSLLEPAIGNSLFIAEGAHWRWQRRAAAPVFTMRNIKNLAPIMSEAAVATCARLADAPGRADMFEEMVQTTFDVISSVTFSGDDAMDSSDMHAAIEAYISGAAKVSLMDVVGVPTWVPRPSRMFNPNRIGDMQAAADAAIERRRKSGVKSPPDLLDLLLDGEDPKTKRQMNTAELRDNLLTFIVAGHETTALTLAWALYLCAFDPTAQERLAEEARAILNGGPATADTVDKLVFTEQVVKEALRLYPPAAFISRTAQGHDTLCDREIRPKDTVMMPIYALHRNRVLWENADRFEPDRFDPKRDYDRYQFLPFGDGPRICIGMQFAMIEAKIILATLISRYQFELVANRMPKPQMILTLRPEGGVHLKISKRD
ncbi:MAG: cytochrome P450 [Pseudomonadota bacterium]